MATEVQLEQWVSFPTEYGLASGKVIEIRPDWVYVERPGHRKQKVMIADLKAVEEK